MTTRQILLMALLSAVFPLIFIVYAWRLRAIRRAIDSAGREVSVTVLKVLSAKVTDDRVYITCDIELSAAASTPFRIVRYVLQVPVLSMNDIRVGAKLKGRVHPDKSSQVAVFLPDGTRVTSV